MLSHAQRPPKAVNDVAVVKRPDSVVINVLANDSNFTPLDTVRLTGFYGPAAASASIRDYKSVTFREVNRYWYGLDTFYYISCAQVSQKCDTGRVIVTVRPRGEPDFYTLHQPDSFILKPMDNDSNIRAGDTIIFMSLIRAAASRAGWSVIRNRDTIKYRSLNPQYVGYDTFSYRSCSRRVPTLCDTGRVLINLYRTPIAYDDSAELTQPDTVTIFNLANDSVLIRTDSLHITSVYGTQPGYAVVQGDTAIVYHPTDFHDRGNDSLYYVTCYTGIPDACDTAMVVVKVILPTPYADFLYDEFGQCQVTARDISELSDSIHWTVHFVSGNGVDTTYGNVSVIDLAAFGDSSFQAEVCLTAYNPSGPSQTCYNFYIQCSASTGIHEASASRIRVYPNPATETLHLDLSQLDRSIYSNIETIQIYDLTGRLLRSTAPDTEVAIPVSDLSTGLYLLRLTDHEGKRNVVSRFEVVR